MSVCHDKDVKDTANTKTKNQAVNKRAVTILPPIKFKIKTSETDLNNESVASCSIRK